MIGKLCAGTETEPRCFIGLFPPEIKTVASPAPSMPGDSPKKVDFCLKLLREAGLNVKVTPHARMNEPGKAAKTARKPAAVHAGLDDTTAKKGTKK